MRAEVYTRQRACPHAPVSNEAKPHPTALCCWAFPFFCFSFAFFASLRYAFSFLPLRSPRLRDKIFPAPT